MEIKKIDNEVINEYPKMNQFNKNSLKNLVGVNYVRFKICQRKSGNCKAEHS